MQRGRGVGAALRLLLAEAPATADWNALRSPLRSAPCYCGSQEDLEASKEQFTEKFGIEPRKEDLTILASKQVRWAVLVPGRRRCWPGLSG